MAEALEWLTEACTAGIEYLKKIRIAEIRQTLELVGVSHVQVVLALLVFAMLQFSKFTVVLLIACLIAYIIFYMGDNGVTHNDSTDERVIRTRNYGPNNSHRNRDDFVSRPKPNLEYKQNYTSASGTDARTSALFPPFPTNHDGETFPDSRLRSNSYEDKTPSKERNSTAESRYNRSRYPYPGPIDDPRSNRRDPLPFRRMISNDYRQYRSTVNDNRAPARYSSFEEPKSRRPQNNAQDYKPNKSRKINSEKRPSSSKNLYGIDYFERLRNLSRDDINRYNPVGSGATNRPPTISRIITRPSETPKKKGRHENSETNQHWITNISPIEPTLISELVIS